MKDIPDGLDEEFQEGACSSPVKEPFRKIPLTVEKFPEVRSTLSAAIIPPHGKKINPKVLTEIQERGNITDAQSSYLAAIDIAKAKNDKGAIAFLEHMGPKKFYDFGLSPR
jgi:hypothetical protein